MDHNKKLANFINDLIENQLIDLNKQRLISAYYEKRAWNPPGPTAPQNK